jgi:hypothetical protein
MSSASLHHASGGASGGGWASEPAAAAAEEGVPPPVHATAPAVLLEPALRPAGYREDLHGEVDEPVVSWLQTIKLPQLVAVARTAGLVVLDDVTEMEEDEVESLCSEASLTTAEARRLRRELRVLRRGGAAVARMFDGHDADRRRVGLTGLAAAEEAAHPSAQAARTFQPYAKPDDIVEVGGFAHRVWVSPFVSAKGGEAALDGEVEKVSALLRRKKRKQKHSQAQRGAAAASAASRRHGSRD